VLEAALSTKYIVIQRRQADQEPLKPNPLVQSANWRHNAVSLPCVEAVAEVDQTFSGLAEGEIIRTAETADG